MGSCVVGLLSAATIFRVVAKMLVALSPSHFLTVFLGMVDLRGCWEKQQPLVPRLQTSSWGTQQ